MKVSKTSWAILTVGILGITLGSLGVTNSQRLSEGKRLSEELAIAKTRLSKLDLKDLYTQQANLETQTKEADARIEADRNRLVQPNDSITVSDAVFSIAEEAGVQVTQISSGPLTRGSVEKVDTTLLPFDVLARGDVANLIDFIVKLNYGFATGQVKLAEIVLPAASVATANVTPDAPANLAADGRPTGHVQIVIHSYNQAK